jgi:hypothetical protein
MGAGEGRKSQRDFALHPKVARNELPWVNVAECVSTPTEISAKQSAFQQLDIGLVDFTTS